mgnify:CR=1 FL=1
MAKGMVRVPVREQDPKVRATNFEEVCLGYNMEEAMEEASRCLNCKNAKCIQGCPVSIDIPAFIQEVKEGNIEEAYKVIGKSSALPAIADEYVHRNRSVKESVSAELKVSRFQSENLKDLLRIMRWIMILNLSVQKRRTDTKLL